MESGAFSFAFNRTKIAQREYIILMNIAARSLREHVTIKGGVVIFPML